MYNINTLIKQEINKVRSTPINGFDNYVVTDTGEIISYKRKQQRTLRPDLNKEGYLRVVLSKDGETFRYSIHRLVAMHYLPNPENKPFVNHKDGNKQNNHVDNLEWCNCSENTKHAFDSMLRIHGENAPNAQLSDSVVEKVCELLQSGMKRKQILELNLHDKLTPSKFDDIRRRRCWIRISNNYVW